MNIPSYLYKTKFAGVYCIENSTNNKRYIGSSNSLYQRIHKHASLLRNDKHENSHLQNAWNKYGEDVFECYVIDFCEEKDLTKSEQFWIDKLKPEYNFTLLVERNILSEESRKRISKTLKEGYASGRISKTKERAVRAFDLDGKFVGYYRTIRYASKQLGITNSSIARVLNGTYYQANGHQFRYAEDATPVEPIEKSKYLRRFAKPQLNPLNSVEPHSEMDNTEPSLA